MDQFGTSFATAVDVWAINSEERAKHDQQFLSLSPAGGYITGEQARTFFLQSGLPAPILAQIWALADLNGDGRMDAQEFSIAMKLIKMRLHGHTLPAVLPPAILQRSPFGTLVGGPPLLGVGGSLGGALVGGPLPAVAPSSLTPPLGTVGISAPIANGVQCLMQPFSTAGTTLPKGSTFGRPGAGVGSGMGPIQMQKALSAEATMAADWAVPQSSRLKYRQLFNSHDKTMSGFLTGPQARNILMQSHLTQPQLAAIWGLSDIDQDGKLTAEEFILAMHLIDMALSGQQLPPALTTDLVPPSFRRSRTGSSVSGGSSSSGVSVSLLEQKPPEEVAEEEQEKKLPVTFEDKKRENFEKGNQELERRRAALAETQRRERERLLAVERAEHERKERERQQQERRRQAELERQLERQREMERQREEERRREVERREAAKRELERQRQMEWERTRRQELLNQRNREQETIVGLKARRKTLEFQLEAVGDKRQQLDGKLQDVRARLSIEQQELERTNSAREVKLSQLETLQKQLQEHQQMLARLVPEKQCLSEQLKQVQQNHTQNDSFAGVRKAQLAREAACLRLRETLVSVEAETAERLNDIDAFNNQLKELREMYSRQQQLQQERQQQLTQERVRAQREADDRMRAQKEAEERARAQKESEERARVQRENEERVRVQREKEERARSQKENEERARVQKESEERARAQRQAEERARYQREAEERARSQREMEEQDQEESKRRSAGQDSQVSLAGEEDTVPSGGPARPTSNQQHKMELANRLNKILQRQQDREPVRKPSDSSESKVAYYRALYPFEARNQDELTILPGDVILVDENQTGEPGWLGGELRGQTGWFPANYSERIPDGELGGDLQTQTPDGGGHPLATAAAAAAAGVGTGGGGGGGGNWADFSTAWPGSAGTTDVGGGTGDGTWESQDSAAAQATSQPVAHTGPPQRQGSAFTPASVSMSPSPTPGQGEPVEGVQAQALYPWRAKKENHLNFNKGDVISVLEQQDMWWFGEARGGQKGWFPKSYVKLISGPVRRGLSVESTSSDGSQRGPSPRPPIPEEGKMKSLPTRPAPAPPASSGQGSPVRSRLAPSPAPPPEEFMTLYAYESGEPGDLTFAQGDIIMVTRREGDWWTGHLEGRSGVFPSNYVRPKDSEAHGHAGKTGSMGKKPEIAQVVASYTATGPEQLTLSPGQLILIRKKATNGWWEGELQARGKKRQIGWFPANYVKLLGPTSGKSTPVMPTEGTKSVPYSTPTVCQVIGVYDYVAQNEDELSFSKGQLISVLSREDPDWWKGELSGAVGFFPSNYVKQTTDTDPSQQWCADLHALDSLAPAERKRQGYIHELIQTEENYMSDLTLVTEVFQKPMAESSILTEEEMSMIFVNWKELIMCNIKLLKALRVRKKMSGERMPVQMIGDILTAQLPHMQPYIRFCSCQLNGATLLQHNTDEQPEFKESLKKLAMDPRCKGMPLSSFLLKPMQRITRYPLIIKNILENTGVEHPDHAHLRSALEKAEELCSQVNEGVREKENSDRLEWIQAHVQCDGLSEQLVFNSVTNCLGPRKFLYSGKLYKVKSSKELFGFLFNDFLLLTQAVRALSATGDKLFSRKSTLQYRMYKTPIFLNEVLVKLPSDLSGDEPAFHISHIDRVYTLRAENINERTAWVQKIKAASELYIETEKKKREKAYQARTQRTTGIGRLMVNIVEGIELKACRSNGKSNPYCEVTMGAQCHITKTIQDSVNPKWNSNCQFFVKDLEQDVLCITVFERDQFSPDDFLGRTEIRVADIKRDQDTKGPISKRLLLHEVPTGEITARLDLQLFQDGRE